MRDLRAEVMEARRIRDADGDPTNPSDEQAQRAVRLRDEYEREIGSWDDDDQYLNGHRGRRPPAQDGRYHHLWHVLRAMPPRSGIGKKRMAWILTGEASWSSLILELMSPWLRDVEETWLDEWRRLEADLTVHRDDLRLLYREPFGGCREWPASRLIQSWTAAQAKANSEVALACVLSQAARRRRSTDGGDGITDHRTDLEQYAFESPYFRRRPRLVETPMYQAVLEALG